MSYLNFYKNTTFSRPEHETNTDERYYSKKDVADEQGNNSINLIWNNYLSFRERKRITIPIKALNQRLTENLYFTNTNFICTRIESINQNLLTLNKKIATYSLIENNSNIFNELSQIRINHLKLESISILRVYDEASNNIPTNDFIKILNGEILPHSKHEKLLISIFNILSNMDGTQNYNYILVKSWFNILFPENSQYIYRKKNLQAVPATTSVSMAVKVVNIETVFNSISNIINKENRFSVIEKISIVYIVIRLGILFKHEENDLIAFLSIHFIINKYWPDMANFISITNLYSNNENLVNKFTKAMKSFALENGRDCTYILDQFSLSIYQILVSLNSEINFKIDKNVFNNNSSPKKYNEKLKYLKNNDPNLSKKQIIFISTNYDFEKFYTINDFQNITKCTYETGRYSLEKLVEWNYFKKEKKGKKFVYSPLKNNIWETLKNN